MSQTVSLEFIIQNGTKQILVCCSKICNEAVRHDLSLSTVQNCRDRDT